MIGLVRPLWDMLHSNSVDTTNTVWRLHSRLTVLLLAFFTVLLSARAYFGDPIDCISGASGEVRNAMDAFCWTLGTFISRDPSFVHSTWDVIAIGKRMGHIPKEERVYQKYYQWIPFILAVQALLFSFPKHIWRFYEKGQLAMLCSGLVSTLEPTAWTNQRRIQTLLFFTQESRNNRTFYVLVYFGCEILNMIIVVVNMLFLNFIFGGFWNSYHPAIQALLSLDMNQWVSYNSLVFPKLAKCDFQYYGPSGSLQSIDALCLLPQNIVNEKIFAFLWLWFILLAVVTGLQLCYRMLQLSCLGVRFHAIRSQLAPISYYRLKRFVREMDIGCWFLLHQMARNVNKAVMRDILFHLARAGRSISKETINQSGLGNGKAEDIENHHDLDDEEDDEDTLEGEITV